jgi:hypothetical protein
MRRSVLVAGIISIALVREPQAQNTDDLLSVRARPRMTWI